VFAGGDAVGDEGRRDEAARRDARGPAGDTAGGDTRRAFLQEGALWLAAAGAVPCGLVTADGGKAVSPALTIGLVTDLHYADKPAAGTRFYRETPRKLEEAIERMRSLAPACVVALGDFVDAAESVDTERAWLARIARQFEPIAEERHFVLGNHCVDTLTKEEFLGEVGQKASSFSFDRDGWHVVILDSCFREDGTAYGRKNFRWDDANVPVAELEWLEHDLAATVLPTVVMAHQRLDEHGKHSVRNREAVRTILESAGGVRAVFQGHSHRNDHQEINGIHYVTLVAMVEGQGPDDNGFALLELFPDRSIKLTGFRRQASWSRA
jgi:UDP-2,3-diacylglucosamine pyrophosphatase LpxH